MPPRSANYRPDQMNDALIKPLEENLWSFWSRFGRARGGTLFDTPELMWFETPVPALPYNAVMRMRMEEGAETEVDRRFAHFAEAGKPFFWVLHPGARPAGLESLLRARGFEEVERVAGMAAWPDEIAAKGRAPEDVEIREVVTQEDIRALIDFIVWRWRIPDGWTDFFSGIEDLRRLGRPDSAVRAWMAWKDGRPAAKAVTCESADSIGLYGVTTRPEARGTGIGRYICHQALEQADGGRGKLLVLHATPMAVSLYRKMGFRDIAPFRLFAEAGSLEL